MRIWFDTEFIEDGKTIDLMSIGLVREDGEVYYAEPAECRLEMASPWVWKNVIPHLLGWTEDIRRTGHECLKPRAVIAKEIIEFAGEKPEFWAYYADYDWVALCQLFGTMMDLPKGWPMYCRDLKQLCDWLGNPPLVKQTVTEHFALNDACWTKRAWLQLVGHDPALVGSRAA